MSFESIYHNCLLLTVLLFPFCILPVYRGNQVISVPRSSWGFLFLIVAVYCMANEPIILNSWTDRGAYGTGVVTIQRNGYHFEGLTGESLFGFYTWIVSLFTDYQGWFYVTAIIYVGGYMVAARRMTREYAFVLFLSMLCCFQFYSYGQNTIRAGFAGALVILGISFSNNLKMMILFFFYAIFCHKSMLIPVGSLAVSYFFPSKTKWFLAFWFICIGVSFIAGSGFTGFFSQFVEGRRISYLTADAAHSTYKMGFRWDFLAYSSIAVALGYYYIYVLNFKSQIYYWIYNAYLIANSFWVLVIRAAFTDRFAYLSWFLFPILLMYPLLTRQLFANVTRQRSMIIYVLWGQFAFTYYMFLAYNGFKPF